MESVFPFHSFPVTQGPQFVGGGEHGKGCVQSFSGLPHTLEWQRDHVHQRLRSQNYTLWAHVHEGQALLNVRTARCPSYAGSSLNRNRADVPGGRIQKWQPYLLPCVINRTKCLELCVPKVGRGVRNHFNDVILWFFRAQTCSGFPGCFSPPDS